MKVPLLDLKAQYEAIKPDVDESLEKVFASQLFINGPQVKECEHAVAEYCGVKYATAVSSGTDALLISLMVSEVGAGDEVITSDYSFFATAGSIARVSAKPVFVDIDPVTFNLDPEQVERCISPQTRAIIPVHLYGQAADMTPILDIAEKHNLIIIEDAAQAIGAEYQGKRAGSFGDFGCFSFFPSKNLGAPGDGGMVTTDEEGLDKKLKIFRNHGSQEKYYHKYIGGNFRFDSIHAAVVLVKLPYLDSWSAKRKQNADYYRQLLSAGGLTADGTIVLPVEVQNRHIYNQFILRVRDRDRLRQFLLSQSIGCEVYYPVPFHLQECFSYLGYEKGDFPESEKAAEQTIALPIYPELTKKQIEYVVETMIDFYRTK